jgi:uncharacterized protein (TIGR03085 family)
MTSFARRERTAICQTLRKLGPEQPTLCQGWSTKDLLVHLIVRENRPDAAVGLFIPFLSSYTDSISNKYKEKSFEELIAIFENGPKSPSPFSLPKVDELANTFEFLVHHEDILRAQSDYQPRKLTEEDAKFIWSRFTKSAVFFMRKVKVGVVAKTDQGTYTLKRGNDVVTITGNVIDLVMFAFGRKNTTEINFEGNPTAVEKLKNSDLSL